MRPGQEHRARDLGGCAAPGCHCACDWGRGWGGGEPLGDPEQASSARLSGGSPPALQFAFFPQTPVSLTHGAPLFPTKPLYSEEQGQAFLPGEE